MHFLLRLPLPSCVTLLLLIWCDVLMAFPSSSSSSLPKLVLLDRDGVINHDVGSPGVTLPSQLQLTTGAAVAIGRLKRAGCTVVLVTNQSCVGKGIISRTQLTVIHDEMMRQLRLDDADATLDRLYVCTTTTTTEDARRKPNGGMMLEAMKDFQVDAADCVLVGDTWTDLQAAAAANVPLRILVSTGYGVGIMGREARKDKEYIEEVSSLSTSLPESILPFYYIKNLACAVDYLMTR